MFVTLLGLTISFFAYWIAFPSNSQPRLDIYLALFSVHIAMAVAYWLISFGAAMDAFLYYRDPFGFLQHSPFESGTYFIVHFDYWIRSTLGGSFLDHFLFFQCFGMIGIALLLRTFAEIAHSLNITVPPLVYLVLFLPGLHFWSVGIGKDGPVMMAGCLAIWSSVRLQKRVHWFILSVIIMGLIRPHIAAISVLAVVIVLLLGKQLRPTIKLVLAPLALAGFIVMLLQVQQRFGVYDLETFLSFLEGQQEFNEKFGSGTDLQSQPFLLKLLSLLFRPLFYDAQGFTEYAASAENFVLLLLFSYLVLNWRTLWRLIRSVDFVAYCFVFILILLPLLAMVNYNVGLGQRQKMMAMPAVIILYSTVYMYRLFMTARARHAQIEPATAGVPAPAG